MDILINYYNSCEELANYFVKRYFGKVDYYWIGNRIGTVIEVADDFFDMNDMAEFIKNRYTRKQLFDYYDARMDKQMKDETFYSIEVWKQIGKNSLKNKSV